MRRFLPFSGRVLTLCVRAQVLSPKGWQGQAYNKAKVLHAMTQRYAVHGAWFAKILLLCVMMATLVLGVVGERMQIARCPSGGCTFWLDGTPWVDATLSKEGSCAQTCTSLSLSEEGIVNIANGTFHDMPELEELYLDRNFIASLPADLFETNTKLQYLAVFFNPLGCVYGVPEILTTEYGSLDDYADLYGDDLGWIPTRSGTTQGWAISAWTATG